GRRVVLVVTGLESAAQRKQEAERLINWAFRAFETRTLYRAGEPLIEAPVWIGAEATLALAPERDVVVTLPIGRSGAPAQLSAHYTSPVVAPIAAGARIGYLSLTVEDMAEVRVPLVATEAIGQGGFVSRLKAAAEIMLARVLPEG
ncbi:MAG: D-alanyl-D-alanine carboxypeptidase, partial [Pseudomonadota bacterium]